jgi:hypothetical protein
VDAPVAFSLAENGQKIVKIQIQLLVFVLVYELKKGEGPLATRIFELPRSPY